MACSFTDHCLRFSWAVRVWTRRELPTRVSHGGIRKPGLIAYRSDKTLCTRKKLLLEEINYHGLGAHESFGCRNYSMLLRGTYAKLPRVATGLSSDRTI